MIRIQRTHLTTVLAAFLLLTGCSTASSGASADEPATDEASEGQGGAPAADEGSAEDAEPTGDEAAQAGADIVPEGFDMPSSCPDIVNLSLPDEEQSLQELHNWFCGRFDASASPAYQDTDGEVFGRSCTLEQVAIQGATRNESGELRCFDDQGRVIGLLMMRKGEFGSVRTYEYDGGDELVRTVSGDAESCYITERQGDTKLALSSRNGGSLQVTSRVDYDDQGRKTRRVEPQGDGTTSVTTFEYTSTDEKTSTTTMRDGQKTAETVEFLRADGSVEREVKRSFSNGELVSASETRFDEQGRVVRKGPAKGTAPKYAGVETMEYEGNAEHPVRRELAQLVDGKKTDSITVTYELDGDGRPVSSTVEYGSGETVEESWSYEDGKLVEKHVVEQLLPGRPPAQKTHFEMQYDEQGRPTSHHRWKGEKDSRSYAEWKTTMAYGCLK